MLLWASSRRLAALVVAWVLASAAAPALVVAALGVVVGRLPGAVEHGIGSPDGHRLLAALAVAAAIYAASLVLDPIGGALGTAAGARVGGRLQGRLLAAVSGPVGIAHLEDPEVLDRLARAEGTLTGFFPGTAPVTWAGSVGTRIAGLIGCAIVASYVWWLGLVLLAMWIAVRWVMLGAVVRQATELRGQTTEMRRAQHLHAVGAKARDAKEVRVFGLGDFLASRFRDGSHGALRRGAPALRALHRRAVLCLLAVVAITALALVTIADDARDHTIDLRALAILLPMLAVTMSVGSVSFDDIALAATLTVLPDVDRLESELTGAELAGREPVGARPREAVRLEAVHFRYPGAAADVLSGVDLELRAGTSTALVGANGAGKSTLVSLLARLRDATGGRILVDGVDLRELEARQWQRRVALMPQEPARYPFSVYDNVAFGALEQRDDRAGIEHAARLAGLLEVVEGLPAGWDTVLARELPGGVELSGGQWQRVALARALFATRHGARLLVLDEPTAALDVRSEAAFYRRFLEITRELTTLVISHRFATVRRADTICVLDGGRIAERGTHSELVAAGGIYARMYVLEARRFG
jgi:ATP-binding cassette subfamily B protein